MKTKVGEYKGKIIVEGGENPENELKPWEMLFPSSEKGNDNNAQIEVLDSPSAIRITNVPNSSDSFLSYQLIQVVIPNSPIYGEFEGTQTRVHVISEGNPVMWPEVEDYQGEIELVDMILGFRGNRNGFPFDPEHYRACKLRIVQSVNDLEVTSDTINWDGGVPSVKFIKYIVNPNN